MKLLIVFLIIFSVNLKSQTIINPNSIYFVGINSDAPKGFSFTINSDIEANTTIYFTDDAFIDVENSLKGSEGTIEFIAKQTYNAGTIFSFFDEANDEFTKSGSFNLSSSGDNIIAYQIIDDELIYIAGIGWGRTNNWEYNNTTNTSDIPKNKNIPIEVIQLGTADNYILASEYFSIDSSDDMDIILMQSNNFIGNNDTAYINIPESFIFISENIALETPKLLDSIVCYKSRFADLEFSNENIFLFSDYDLKNSIDSNSKIISDTTIYIFSIENNDTSSIVPCSVFLKNSITEHIIEINNDNTLSILPSNVSDWFCATTNDYLDTGVSFTPSETGEYYAQFTDNYGCEIKTNKFLFNLTNINNEITFEKNEILEFEVYDIWGAKLLKAECSFKELIKRIEPNNSYIIKYKKGKDIFSLVFSM
jgi:hypothetical protein